MIGQFFDKSKLRRGNDLGIDGLAPSTSELADASPRIFKPGQLSLIKFWLHVKGFRLSPTKSDAENIFTNYLNDSKILDLPPKLLHKIESDMAANEIKSNLFDEAHLFVWTTMEHRYFKRYLHSVFYAKYQLEVLECRQLNLADVIRSHGLLSSFVEFLEENRCRNLLEFVIAVDAFVMELNGDELNGSGGRTANSHQEDAMLIYDRFISMQATDPIGIGDDVRIAVESGICTEDGVPKSDAFDKAKCMAMLTLQKTHMPAFLKSDYFTRLIAEMRQNIEAISQMSSYNASIHRSSNTSLPTTSNNSIKGTGPLLRYHSQTCDDDNNWGGDANDASAENRRKQKCSSLAKIDKFGRYTPLFDNTLINEEEMGQISSRTRLKNTLDKYLNQTAMKESVAADEMAELLISGIQNMVLSANAQRI